MERYEQFLDWSGGKMIPDSNGDWVKWADVLPLLNRAQFHCPECYELYRVDNWDEQGNSRLCLVCQYLAQDEGYDDDINDNF